MHGPDRYDKLADAVCDVLVLVDEHGRVEWINPAGATLLGHPREALLGHSVFEVVHPDDQDYARTGFDALSSADGPHGPIRLRIDTAERGWRTIELMGTNALDDADLGGIVISGRDITASTRPTDTSGFDADRLRHLVDATGDVVLLLGRDDTIAFVNAAVGPLLGYQPAELLGQSWLDLVVDEDLERLATEDLDRLMAPSANVHTELRLLRRDGEVALVEVDVANERDNPAIEGIVVTVRDVSDLRRTKERLANALASARVGVVELDVDGRITTANDVLLELTGEELASLAGRPLEDSFAEPDRTAVRAAIEWLLSGHETATGVEGRWATGDGADPWVTVRLTADHDRNGAPRDITCFVTDITRRKEQEADLRELNEELARYATHDALTDLPNRFLFNDHLERALARVKRSGGEVAVLFCDLDWFKEVNDTFGHGAGDEVLITAAERLRANLRPNDLLSRFGGDEFAVLVEELPHRNDVIALANRLVQAMSEPVAVADGTATVGLSVGIALSDASSTPTTLLQHADAAVYEAKARGRGRYAFSPDAALDAPASPQPRPF